MQKTLILLEKNININSIDNYLKDEKYKNVIISYNIDDIKKDDIGDIIYIGSCKRYNNTLDFGNIILVNEAFTKINNEDKRLLSSFSLNYYIGDTSDRLNRSISIVNILSNNKDKNIEDYMYNKYSCLASDNNSYKILNKAFSLNKKCSCLLKVVEKSKGDYNDLFEIAIQSLL